MKRKNIVGENLREIRISMKLTQEEAALRSGLSQGYINQLESGKRMFTQKSLEQIAEALNMPIINFFYKKEKEKAVGVCEEVSEYKIEYKRKKKSPSKKEILALLHDLPPQLREHYLTLLKLEKELWGK
ncbi:MAG: helix-turn-helix transcriptional regulator [Thermodesulfovibrionia bacterium]|nr:helix-turn-helix transcriptional regulator [Thermodesulfovibrionia bacterium]